MIAVLVGGPLDGKRLVVAGQTDIVFPGIKEPFKATFVGESDPLPTLEFVAHYYRVHAFHWQDHVEQGMFAYAGLSLPQVVERLLAGDAPAKWVTTWANLDDDKRYLVACLNQYGDGPVKLGNPIELCKGWEVRRLRQGCYAALAVPELDPPPVGSKT